MTTICMIILIMRQPGNCLVLFRHFGNDSLFISWHMDVWHTAVDISCSSNELFFGTPQGDAKCFQKFYKQAGSHSGNLYWACFDKKIVHQINFKQVPSHVFPWVPRSFYEQTSTFCGSISTQTSDVLFHAVGLPVPRQRLCDCQA